MQRTRLAALAIIAGFAISAPAQEAPQNFRLWPVTTELQRALVAPEATTYGVINCNGLVQDGKIDPTALRLPEFRRKLSELAKRYPGTLVLHLRLQNWQSQPAVEEFLESALIQLGKKAGFERVVSGRTYTGGNWLEEISAVSPQGEVLDADESPTHDERVHAYPVRTTLSRYLTGNADCFVAIRPPFDGRTSGVSDDTRRSIEMCISKLNLSGKQSLSFRITTTKAGESAAEAFIGPGNGADALAKSLGFERSTVSQVPTSGAPEKLVGQPAPDFTLRTLEGGEINLRDAIRGRVALVSFWGVGCGPCRLEAPHLSELHKRYDEAGFLVIAVNAYEESEEVVRGYAEKQGLTHPIALSGGEIARNKYFVGAYPTSFWIDRTGKVIDYGIGFDPGDEKEMSRMIERLLARPR